MYLLGGCKLSLQQPHTGKPQGSTGDLPFLDITFIRVDVLVIYGSKMS